MPHLMHLLFKHQFCFPLKESTPRPKSQPVLQSSHTPSPRIKTSETQLSTSRITQSYSSQCVYVIFSQDAQNISKDHQFGGRNTLLRYNRAWRKLPWDRVGPRLKEIPDATCHILPFQIQVNFFSFAFANDNIVC